MDDYGFYIRKMRQEKSMTLKDLAHGIVSIPFLSKFERGEHDITISKFIQLLDRLNISLNEFEKTNHLDSGLRQEVFMGKFDEAIRNDDVGLMQELIKQEERNLSLDHNLRHEHNCILLKQWINKLVGLDFEKNQIKTIENYLLNTEVWGFYELSLFGNMVFCLSIDNLVMLSRTAFKRAIQYSKLSTVRHDYSIIIENIIISILEGHSLKVDKNLSREELMQIKELLILAEKSLENSKFYYEKNKLDYLNGLFLIVSGSIQEGENLSREAIALMRRMGNDTIARAHEKELKKYLQF